MCTWCSSLHLRRQQLVLRLPHLVVHVGVPICSIPDCILLCSSVFCCLLSARRPVGVPCTMQFCRVQCVRQLRRKMTLLYCALVLLSSRQCSWGSLGTCLCQGPTVCPLCSWPLSVSLFGIS